MTIRYKKYYNDEKVYCPDRVSISNGCLIVEWIDDEFLIEIPIIQVEYLLIE